VIVFVVDRVAQEDTPGGTWGELMWRGGSRVRVARTIKDAQIVTPRVMKTLVKVINKQLGANTNLNQKVDFKNKV
jgi:hypothetical protein